MSEQRYYTVQELSVQTGYAISFIYDLTHYGCVAPPIRGLVKGKPGKGLYPSRALTHLHRYMELKRAGLKRIEIFCLMKNELQSESEAECLGTTKEKVKKPGA